MDFTGDETNEARGIKLLLVAGALYVGAVVLRQPLVGGLVALTSPKAPPTSAAWPIAWLLVLFIPMGVLAIELARTGSVLRHSLHPQWRSAVWVGLSTGAVSILLNATGWWPYTWRWPATGIFAYARQLLLAKAGFSIATWVITGVIVVPFLEEVIFRVALLRGICSRTGHAWFGILASSLVFAGLHLGTLSPLPDTPHVINSGWLFAASLIIGHTTVRRSGSIQPALAAHVIRNGLEVGLLIASLVR